MDIKSSSVRAIYLLGLLVLLSSSASALRRKRGDSRSSSRQKIRRGVRDYLSPPAQDASYTSYGPPGFHPPPSLLSYRPGRNLSPPPPLPRPSTEGPGYFARLASWLNPFGGSPTPPPFPQITVPPYVGKYVPSLSQVSNGYGPPPARPGESYGPPSQQQQPQPPPPASSSHGYLPPSTNKPGKNCNPCNVAPWNPLLGPIQEDGHSDAVRIPDFFSPPSAPIPYPHLYPGPMPPLFKAKPFIAPSANFRPTTQSDYEGTFGPPPSFAGVGSSNPDPEDGHVDVLPPGAEVDDSGSDAGPPPGYNTPDIRDSPPPGYHGEVYENPPSLTVEQSKTVHEEHLSTELTAGYKIQDVGGSGNVEIAKSPSTAEYLASVDHPIHYEQSPLIDLTRGKNGIPPSDAIESGEDNYTAGLNPPSRDEAAGSYSAPEKPRDSSAASTITNGTFAQPTTSYGIPDVGGLPIALDPHGEAAKSQLYEAYPPPREVESPGVGVLDSYQRQVDQSKEGLIGNPEPLVPYRPSSLYVPYPPYSGPTTRPEAASSTSALDSEGQTTEEPFLEALLKSYNNFKEEMDAKEEGIQKEHGERFRSHQDNQDGHKESASYSSSGATTWVSQPRPSFSSPEKINPSILISGTGNSPASKQERSGVKKNKQVQIIIPYTSQYAPGPFRPQDDDWSGRGPLEYTQPRKVPSVGNHEQNYVGEESKSIEIARPLRPLENILINELAIKGEIKNNNKNNSIDVLRLQKNIDNWTIQEYSRGITSSTALPSSSHPYLLPSKIIPNEYLTSTQSSSSSSTDNQREINDSRGLNYNDLEHEGAASSRVDVPHVQILRVEGVTKPVNYRGKFSSESRESSPSFPSSSSTTTSTEASWAELPVSISPHNNERVYVVTPQPEGSSSNNLSNKLDDRRNNDVIERAYQVLPQAVNNLASTSASGPDASPLWGIMEHDEYARNYKDGVSTVGPPILYSGHSKVSNGSH